MTRKLIVLRHAKSAWDTDAKSDHARPLNKRGRRDAPRVAAEIARLGWGPDRVISSDALRTKQTWKRMHEAFGVGPGDVTFTSSFYGAGLEEIASALAEVSEPAKVIMVIGHNPGWEDAVSQLTGEAVDMTTCNAALLHSAGSSWTDVTTHRWTLENILRPKEL